jgi:hypothetical protein
MDLLTKTTKQSCPVIAERCGRPVSPTLLHATIANGKLAAPRKNAHGFYTWTPADIEAAVQALLTDRRRKEHRQALAG